MASPTVTASLNKATYQPGETMSLTVSYGDADTKPVTVTITVTDAEGNASSPATVTCVVDPLTVAVSDNGSRVWAKVSDSGTVAVFQATA